VKLPLQAAAVVRGGAVPMLPPGGVLPGSHARDVDIEGKPDCPAPHGRICKVDHFIVTFNNGRHWSFTPGNAIDGTYAYVVCDQGETNSQWVDVGFAECS
jgi:hypothetical protein